MKALFSIRLLLAILLLSFTSHMKAQSRQDTTLYLITCGPGTETYSIYGHSALLVNIAGRDTVYNWGIFDFDAPNFAWNFAKGKLDYMLGQERLRHFISGYFYEGRYVLSQKINLEPREKRIILELVNENLRPENVKYRYDFFYDDCSTRIRDLLEKSIGNSLKYAPEKGEKQTFRDLIGEYEKFYPWQQFGIDLLIGSNAEKEADIRDKMFLPDYLMSGLSAAKVNRNGVDVLLLDKAETLLDFDPPVVNRSFYTSPFFVLSMLLLLIAFLSLQFKTRVQNNMIDFILFLVLSILSVLMIFFNFFTDHEQLRANFNILWLNPFIIVLFIAILVGRSEKLLSRVVFFITLVFLFTHLFIPQAFNIGNYPLILIIILRTMARSGFKWSPVKIE
ncbi:MAG: DUF4105 domain-containing protein [Chloroflexota bacterium]